MENKPMIRRIHIMGVVLLSAEACQEAKNGEFFQCGDDSSLACKSISCFR